MIAKCKYAQICTFPHVSGEISTCIDVHMGSQPREQVADIYKTVGNNVQYSMTSKMKLPLALTMTDKA